MKELTKEQIKLITEKYDKLTYNEYDYLSHSLELHLKAIRIIYNAESLLENGVNTEEDLKEFVYFVYGRFYSYRRDKDEEALLESFRNYLKCCSNYGSDVKLSWQTKSANSYALVPIIPESDVPNLTRFFKEYAATESAKELIKEKINFIDESKIPFYDMAPYIHTLSLKDDLLVKILEYHLKKKKKKTVFYSFIENGLLTDSIMEKVKVSDAALADMVLGYLKQNLTRKIRIEDIQKIKKLKKISKTLTNEILLVIVEKFIKESQKEKMSCAQIEVILVMFFHYLGKNIQEDIPEAALLLAIQLDEEVDV